MRAFVIAIVAAVVIAAGAAAILNMYQRPVDQVFATEGVRLDRHNG